MFQLRFSIPTADDRLMSQVLDQCEAVGFEPRIPGSDRPEVCRYWSERYGKNATPNTQAGMVATALQEIRADRNGLIDLYGEQEFIRVSVDVRTNLDWPSYGVHVSPAANRLTDGLEDTSQKAAFGRTLVDAVRRIAVATDADYVWSFDTADPENMAAATPTENPVSEHVTHLAPITVFSPATVDRLGGREHVLATPAYRVDELETGQIMILKYERVSHVSRSEGDAHLFGT